MHKQSSGTIVEVNVICCYPGYHFDNKTEVCQHNHNDTNIVRPGPYNRYLYIKVKIYYTTNCKILNMSQHYNIVKINLYSYMGSNVLIKNSTHGIVLYLNYSTVAKSSMSILQCHIKFCCSNPHDIQDNIYVDKYEVRSNVTEELKTAVIPPTFHKCDKQGFQPGCKFKFDSLEEQCSDGREGY
jgi:hypothetical protein